MRTLCVCMLVFVFSLYGADTIEELEQKKQIHKNNIVKHLEKAHRWQFNQAYFLEAKREYLLAEQEEEQLLRIERKIQGLRQKSH